MTIDPRTTGTTLTHSVPYPIAELYRHHRTHPDVRYRYRYAFQLIEATLKFLSFVTLSDALIQSPEDARKKADTWFKHLKNPSLFGLNLLLQSTAASAARSQDPFLPEVNTLLDGNWKDIEFIWRDDRNFTAHYCLNATEAEAQRGLSDIRPAMHELLTRVCFLRRYRLGHVYSAYSVAQTKSKVSWRECRGTTESGETRTLRTTERWPERVPLLLDPVEKRGLVLFPMLRWNRHTEPGRLEWLSRLLPKGEDTRTGIEYRHPVHLGSKDDGNSGHFRTPWSEAGHADEINESDQRAWLAKHLANPSEYLWRFPLGLDEESTRKLGNENAFRGSRRYEYVGELGKGGMARVYEADDTVLKKRIALKVLDRALSESPEHMKRFEHEFCTLKRLQSHPNLVCVEEFFLLPDEQPAYSMELLEGSTLKDLVQHSAAQFSPEQITHWLDGALAGLEHAHTHSVVHRDVSPSNLFICADGTVKLIDFGIAKDTATTAVTRTGTLSRMGTEKYQSPEQRDNPTLTGPASDVYSLGRVLYFLLERCSPPIHNEALGHARPELSSSSCSLTRRLARIYDRATAYKPAERYASAAEMRTALHRQEGVETAETATAASSLPQPPSTTRAEPAQPQTREDPATLFALPETGLPPYGMARFEALRSLVQQSESPTIRKLCTHPTTAEKDDLDLLRDGLAAIGLDARELDRAMEPGRTSRSQDAIGLIGCLNLLMHGDEPDSLSDRALYASKCVTRDHRVSNQQRQWLDRLLKHMQQEECISRAALDRGRWKAKGGFAQLDRLFNRQLEDILDRIQDSFWDDLDHPTPRAP